jgi:hypothetical protein
VAKCDVAAQGANLGRRAWQRLLETCMCCRYRARQIDLYKTG